MKRNLNSNHNGFTVVELLIVVVVIGLLAGIAIPNFLTLRRSANESSAISSLRIVHGAQGTYASSFGLGNYAGNSSSVVNVESFTHLGEVGIIDKMLAGGLKSGYLFTGAKIDRTAANASSFCVRAVPVSGSGLFATGPHNIAIATPGVMYSGDAGDINNAGCSIVDGGQTVTSAFPLGT